MTSYRCISERLRRPLAAVAFLIGVFILAEAIWVERGLTAYMYAVSLLVGSVVSWLVPSGTRLELHV
jgi:hypothetical protein